MHAYGNVRRIAILSPYWPVMNAEAIRYFTDMGFEVVRDVCLLSLVDRHRRANDGNVARGHYELDGDDIDAIVQIGTNLSMVRLAAAAEMWLGKPVIAINTATYWHALRANDINDKIEGFGRLLADFWRWTAPLIVNDVAAVHRIVDLDPFAVAAGFFVS